MSSQYSPWISYEEPLQTSCLRKQKSMVNGLREGRKKRSTVFYCVLLAFVIFSEVLLGFCCVLLYFVMCSLCLCYHTVNVHDGLSGPSPSSYYVGRSANGGACPSNTTESKCALFFFPRHAPADQRRRRRVNTRVDTHTKIQSWTKSKFN